MKTSMGGTSRESGGGRRILAMALASSAALLGCDEGTTPELADGESDVALVGKADGVFDGCQQSEVLSVVNAAGVSVEGLKGQGLHTRAAKNILGFRAGVDGLLGTEDDQWFADLHELDAVPWVGPVAFEQLMAMVEAPCVAWGATGGEIEVMMSPQPWTESHLARAQALMGTAERSLDIAMYSFRDASLLEAVGEAVARGVSVRVIFESAKEDKKDPEGTRSALLEEMGADVRYVNKIMHHKFVLIDGPRSAIEDAMSGVLSSGSANWSWSAGTKYDEATLFAYGNARLNLLFQKEFNHMWTHARDFVWAADLEPAAAIEIRDSMIPPDPSVDAVYTSVNFEPYVHATYGPTFKTLTGSNHVADRIVELIEGAESSILVASAHLRSRPIAEALMAKAMTRPELDIRVLLDGQEYTSWWKHQDQSEELEACLESAGGSESDKQMCLDVGFYFGWEVQASGIPLRYKWYAYRWHYSYAIQMHHKYMVIDESTVAVGSYNLSDNAEHETFENLVIVHGWGRPEVAAAFVENFEDLWTMGEADDLAGSLEAAITDDVGGVPLVFTPMAVSTEQIAELKSAIAEACPDVNTPDFKKHPESHKVCYP